ncbi:helix-turn-helix domain-containing protein [Magnetospirillum sp. UT-4]|uniref:helix-turn-helix domain-containing protein n=1 Tax=Magnetospirillum sp. UT-4 TaxID=2681467 RepID=UPI001384B881|nr:helix-turn-helix domain-containing protein [Magnetospirillum sp. UT-4]CAA7624249.1 cAMP-binding proteins-catabolite gene activator and regulatory subunit of cAMP-dependent protein [Magnetospirillum sp. UT-4]
MTSEALAILRRHPLFEAIPTADMPLLLDNAAAMSAPRGTLLFRQGDPAERLFVIGGGLVELVYAPTAATTPEVRAVLGAGETAGADALKPGARHTTTARVVEPLRAACVSADRLAAYLDDKFDLALSLIGIMAGSLRGQVREITELKLQSTTERLAGYLLQLAGGCQGRSVVHLPFEKRLLAERLGMEPATLSRAFAKLRDFGVETGRGDRVEIAELAHLQVMVEAMAPAAPEDW